MRKNGYRKAILGICALLLALGSATAHATPTFVPGELVVKRSKQPSSLSTAADLAPTRILGDYAVLRPALIGLTVAADATTRQSSNDPQELARHRALCAELKRAGTVEKCSPNFIVHANLTPEDPYYTTLRGLARIRAPRAWKRSTGSSEVVVAVIDTGVDYTHPDLADNIWINPNEIANGIDDDDNGYIDDLHGINTITGSGDPMDDHSHGTHVSGTIGAVGNNNIGITGVAWTVRIMGIKFLNRSGSGDIGDAIAGIQYAVANGARVLNNSWGGAGYDEVLDDAIKSATANGALFVAAAGNEAVNNDSSADRSYPSSYNSSGILAVAAIASNGKFAASFSNYGKRSVDIAAPGVGILSTVPDGGYDSYSGTSMATPHVSGAAALLLSANSSLTVAQLRSAILKSARKDPSLTKRVATGGYLDVAAALARVR